jgi:asparagine synthetase B (glutamine-hydrolysing)
MTDSIVHRAVLTGRASSFADGIGLGARRLSIIHVAGGTQPTANENHWIQVQ